MPGADASLRRRRLLHAAIAAATAVLALSATAAVRYELDHGQPAGAPGALLTLLEFVFITAIIPLIVTTIYYGASALRLHRRLRRRPTVPEARVH